MKSSLLHTVVYAAALAIVCATLLTAAAELTGPYRKANQDAEEKKTILSVLGVAFSKKGPASDLLEVFDANVRKAKGREVYEYVPAGGEVRAVAVPFSGRGLWGPVKGYLALDPELTTIRGISFYDHEETPGLGGEISEDWFQDQFKGKSIRGADGEPGIRILKEPRGAPADNEVDGITGATMTCRKIEQMLNDRIRRLIREHREHGR